MHIMSKRKESAVAVAVVPVVPVSPMRTYVDAPMDIPDEPIPTEEELRAWSEFDVSRPTSPSPVTAHRSWRLPKRYQGVFQERYILAMLLLIVLLFVASTFQMDTKAELEEIKRMYDVGGSQRPSVQHRANPTAGEP